jgi:hypothetical protein
VLILLVLSTSVDHNTVIPKLGNAFCQENDHSSTPSNFFNLFESTRHPISAKTYRDASGEEFRIAPDGPWWHKPLKDEVLILDIDTRAPQGPNEVWSDGRMEWESIKLKRKGSAASASFLNHFLYGEFMISGQQRHSVITDVSVYMFVTQY